MDDNCGEWGWNVCVWLVGVISMRRVFFFKAASLPFVMFFVLVSVLFVINFYVLKKFFAQYKHMADYGRPTAAI